MSANIIKLLSKSLGNFGKNNRAKGTPLAGASLGLMGTERGGNNACTPASPRSAFYESLLIGIRQSDGRDGRGVGGCVFWPKG